MNGNGFCFCNLHHRCRRLRCRLLLIERNLLLFYFPFIEKIQKKNERENCGESYLIPTQ